MWSILIYHVEMFSPDTLTVIGLYLGTNTLYVNIILFGRSETTLALYLGNLLLLPGGLASGCVQILDYNVYSYDFSCSTSIFWFSDVNCPQRLKYAKFHPKTFLIKCDRINTTLTRLTSKFEK